MNIAEKFIHERTEFNKQFRINFNNAVEELQTKIERAQKNYLKKLEHIEKAHIDKAIKQAGNPELADQMILDRVEFDKYNYKWVVIPETHGVIPQEIKSFHAQAMLRNLLPEYMPDLFKIASISIGEPNIPDTKEVDELEEVMGELQQIRRDGKEYHHTPNTSTQFRTAQEMREHMENNYGKLSHGT